MLSFNNKILVVSSWAPPGYGASPHFFYNLFNNFNRDSYVLYTDKKNFDKKSQNPTLPCKYFFFNDGLTRLTFIQKQSKWKIIRTIAKIILFFSDVKNGYQIVKNEKIDLLFGTADKGWALAVMFFVSRISGKPYVLYFLDLYRWNNFGTLRNIFAIFFEPVLFRYAKKIFVMSEGHKYLYEKKYGHRYNYEIITNCHNIEERKVSVVPFKPVAPYEILYTGNIYWPQERSIRILIEAVSRMDNLDIHVSIYTPKRMKVFEAEFSNNPKVSFYSVSQKDMLAIQQNADILFLPLSWNTPSREVVEMAIPGKTAEYLISGRPILILAPSYSFLSRYAQENKFAHVISEENVSLVQDGIKKIITDIPYSVNLVQNAKILSAKNYNVHKNAEKLRISIDKLCL